MIYTDHFSGVYGQSFGKEFFGRIFWDQNDENNDETDDWIFFSLIYIPRSAPGYYSRLTRSCFQSCPMLRMKAKTLRWLKGFALLVIPTKPTLNFLNPSLEEEEEQDVE